MTIRSNCKKQFTQQAYTSNIIYNNSDSDITLKRNGYNFATIVSKNAKHVFAFDSSISVLG